jgi:hypothetical protein
MSLMKTFVLSLATLVITAAVTLACDDPSCQKKTERQVLKPTADPISTPNALGVFRKPCDPKMDPSCDGKTPLRLQPVADPISTPGAKGIQVACDEPGCAGGRKTEGRVTKQA